MSQERRHFRIDLDALVRTHVIQEEEAHELAAAIQANHPAQSQADTELSKLNKQIQDSINLATTRDLQTGHLFDLINQKLNLLLNELQIQHSHSANPDEPTTQMMPINLSGGGALIYSQHELTAGSLLDLTITLIPEHVAIRTVARSVKAFPTKEDPNGPWQAAIEFTHMHEDDQDRVVRKVLQEQTKQLRERKKQSTDQES